MPLTSGLFLIDSARGSIIKVKIRGEKGHPCLVPLEIWKVSDALDVKILAEGLEYCAEIADNENPLSPNLFRTACK